MSAGLRASFALRRVDGSGVRVDGLSAGDVGLVTALLGPTGAGKTSVLRCLAGLERPERGTIVCRGETWLDAAAGIAVPARARSVGYVFQELALFPHLSAAANIGFGVARAARAPRVSELLERLDLTAFAAHRPGRLSGGQQQRVALARALARRPALLLLDEPLSAQDPALRGRLRSELRGLVGENAVPTLFVTHDRAEALALADQVAVFDGGEMIQCAATAAVFARPASLRVAAIVGTDCVIPVVVRSVRAGLAEVAAGTGALVAPAVEGLGARAFACIRAEDVLLLPGEPGQSSARNRLRARVVALEAEGHLLRVRLDAGFPLAAMVTRPAADELGLAPGAAVWALLKASAVHLVPSA